MSRFLLPVTLLCIAFLVSACGALFDASYALGDGKTSMSVPDSVGTGQSETRTEYEVTPAADQSLGLQCFVRTRAVERGWTVTKTYEYRGGYEKSTYSAAAIADLGIGGLLAGIMLGICTSDSSDVSCVNTAWAAPFAVDLVYSLIRRSQARPAVLVSKSRSGDQMQYGQAAEQEATQCQSVASLHLGASSGPSDEQRLNGQGAQQRELSEGALQLSFDENGSILLSDEAVSTWAMQSWASLWILDTDGQVQSVQVDRCTALRPLATRMSVDALQAFNRDCPLPAPSQP